jgi:uncharacterized protein DUF2829
MNLGWAIVHMMVGNKFCRRAAWPKDWAIAVQKPDANSKMTKPYIYLTTTMGETLVPWTPTQADLLAEDYEWA